MRVFTDGSCTKNGQKGAKGGYAAWFPENREWSSAARLSDIEPQTNQRAELSGIRLAVETLLTRGCQNEDIVIYTDSDYSINCLTKWITGWKNRGWKTAEGKDVLHQDLIKGISESLSKFRSHRFHHVRAHTGGSDDLSVNNDVVDRMATNIVSGTATAIPKADDLPPPTDDILSGCPLKLMGGPVRQPDIVRWMRDNLNILDADTIDKHLFKAFTELCKARDVTLTKSVIQKVAVIRAERHLQIEHPVENKEE